MSHSVRRVIVALPDPEGSLRDSVQTFRMWRKLLQCFIWTDKRTVRNKLSGLIALPNELLLLIAGEMDSEDRRRLSNTCFRLFHLIRNQSQWGPYHTMRRVESIEIREHEHFQIILINSHQEFPEVISSFVVHSSESSDCRESVEKILETDGIITNPVYRNAPGVIGDTTVSIIGEAVHYFMADQLKYVTNEHNFNWLFAMDLWRIHPCLSVVVLNEFRDLWRSDEAIYEMVLNLRLYPFAPWAKGPAPDLCELRISDRRNTAIPPLEYDESTRRLFDKIALKCAEKRRIQGELKVEFEERITAFEDHRELYVKIEKEKGPVKENVYWMEVPEKTFRRLYAEVEELRLCYTTSKNCRELFGTLRFQ